MPSLSIWLLQTAVVFSALATTEHRVHGTQIQDASAFPQGSVCSLQCGEESTNELFEGCGKRLTSQLQEQHHGRIRGFSGYNLGSFWAKSLC